MIEQQTQIKKKQISAEIIADSLSPQSHRLTTFVVTFPRIVLSEFNTHRMFSRNSASSRAIPFNKMVKMVQEDPFIPIAWQKEHSGMQGTEYYTNEAVTNHAKDVWLESRDNQVRLATELSEGFKGENPITKQFCNRLLEPFMWHTVIITAHELENFFALRCPQYEDDYECVHRSKKDYKKNTDPNNVFTEPNWLKINKGQAEIHIMALAEVMWDVYNENKPKELKAGEWHIPFGNKFDEERLYDIVSDNRTKMFYIHPFGEINDLKLKIASARCARVSYINYEGKDDYEADLKLFDRLVVAEPIHASPVEHCARAMTQEEYEANVRGEQKSSAGVKWSASDIQGWSGNFRGFIALRKMFPNENKI